MSSLVSVFQDQHFEYLLSSARIFSPGLTQRNEQAFCRDEKMRLKLRIFASVDDLAMNSISIESPQTVQVKEKERPVIH